MTLSLPIGRGNKDCVIKRNPDNEIPFEIVADPFYSESNIKALEERIANIESGKSVPKKHDLIEV